uniref:Uncharacterized protein n=1 Tax=Lepidosiren paradoxus TaxID=7883 RepID=A0A1S5VGV5_LEPPA|nr:hypothetical protein [Lepidosiren paradoxa]
MASDKETDKPRARMEVDIPSEAFDVSGNRLTLTEDEEEEEESEGESLDLSFALVQPDNTNRLLCQAIYPSSGTLDNEAAKHQTVKECPVSNSQKNSYEKIIVISHTSKTHVHDLEGDMDKTELCRIIKSVEMDCEENSSNLKSSDRKRSSDTEVSTESPEGLKIPKGDLHLMKAFDLSSATRSKGNDFKDSSMSYFEGMKKDKWTESKQSAIISDTLVTHKVDVENKLGSLTDFKTMYGKNKEEFEENSSLPVEEISSRKNSENEQSSIDLDGQTIDNISVETSREQKLDLHKMLEKKDVDSEGLPSPSRESEGMTSSLIESNTGVSNFRKNGKATDLVGIIKATVNKYEEYAHSFDTGLASESVCETSISTVNPDTPVALSVGSQAELKMSILSKNRAFEEEEDTKCVPSSNKDLDIMWTATAEVVAIESETLVTHNSNLGTELEKPDHLSKLSNVVETQCEENLHLYGKYLNRGPGGTAEVTITGSATLMAYKADMDSEEGKKIDVNMANETSEDNAESLPFSGRQFRSHELDNRNGIPLLFMVDKVNVENRVEKMFSLQDISKVKDKDYSESFHSSNENSEMSQNFKTERKPTITDAVSTPVVVLQSTDGKSSDLSRLNETRKENNTECSLLSDGDSVREQYMPFKSVALPFSVTSTSGENVPHSYFHNNDTNVQMHVETVYEMLLDDEHYTSQKDQESLLSSQKCFIVDKAVFPFEETDVESKTEKVLDLSKADKSMKEDHDENVSDDQDLETKRNYVTEDDIGLLGGLIGEDDLLQKMEQKLCNRR